MNRSIEMLEIVAQGLGALRDRVVFVGGSTVMLYSEDPAAGGVRPTDPDILGFANRWHNQALSRARDILLPGGLHIQILRPEYFVATKLEARKLRSGEDIRLSADLEDIVFLVDARPSLVSEIRNAEQTVRQFIAVEMMNLRSHPLWWEALVAVLGAGPLPATRDRIERDFANLPLSSGQTTRFISFRSS